MAKKPSSTGKNGRLVAQLMNRAMDDFERELRDISEELTAELKKVIRNPFV